MSSKKALFFKACSLLPMAPLMKINRSSSLFIPIYHAITNERLLHLEHILPYGSKNARQFENDLDMMLKHLKPISYDELYACYRDGKPVPPRRFIITFDDGLRQTYELATEIMLRKGVPAIFFLNTAVLDNKALLHRYKASVLIEHLKAMNDEALAANVTKVLLEHGIDKGGYYAGIKNINYTNRELYDIIAERIGYSFSNYLLKQQPYMSSTQVSDLAKKGFILGSHSEWHPEYWNIDTHEQVRQTESAMQTLAQQYGETRRSFSFPFTDIRTPMGFFNELKDKAPFELLFGSQKLKHDVVPNMVHRFDGDNNLSDMQTYMKALLLFQTVNRLLGKSIVKRATA